MSWLSEQNIIRLEVLKDMHIGNTYALAASTYAIAIFIRNRRDYYHKRLFLWSKNKLHDIHVNGQWYVFRSTHQQRKKRIDDARVLSRRFDNFRIIRTTDDTFLLRIITMTSKWARWRLK